jgi:hypothetical protein
LLRALPLAHEWIAGDQSALEVGAEQVKRLAALSEVRPLVTMDSAYSGPAWLKATVDAPFDSLGRLRPNRVLYRQKPPYAGFGRPAVHGPALKLRRAETWFNPDEALCVRDEKLGRLEMTVWHTVHFRAAPDHPVTVAPNPARVVVSVAGRVIADTKAALRPLTRASSWSGVGVMRRRSVPRGTVG